MPHGWDAGVIFEETTRTLFCGDLFTRLGGGPALTTTDIVEPAMEAEDFFALTSLGPTLGGYLTENWGWQYICLSIVQ